MSARTTFWGYIELKGEQLPLFQRVKDDTSLSNNVYRRITNSPISTAGYCLSSFAYCVRGGYEERSVWIIAFEEFLSQFQFLSAKLSFEFDDKSETLSLDYIYDYDIMTWKLFT